MAIVAVPPAHSPVSPRDLWRAVRDIRQGADLREALATVIAERYDADAVVLCDSGTHALQLAIELAARETGRDAVALPAYACFDVATAGCATASRLEFYDVDPDTLRPDAATLDAALATKVAAVVVVHPFGLPMSLEAVRERAAAAGAVLIEDAAQAHGGAHHGRPLGALAGVSVLSFGRGKGWTGGAGGALLLRGRHAEDAVAMGERLCSPPSAAALLARLGAQWALGRPALYGVPSRLPWLGLGETHFQAPTEPRAMSPLAGAVALATDAAALREAEARHRHARALRGELASVEGLWLPPEPAEGDVAGYLRLPLRRPGRAAEVLAPAAHRLGVLPSYPRPLPDLPQVRRIAGSTRPTPGARLLARELFTAPVHRWVTESVVRQIVAMLAAMNGRASSREDFNDS